MPDDAVKQPWVRRGVIGDIRLVEFIGFQGAVFASIYCIEKNGAAVYVGSTTQPIRQRIRAHIGDANKGSPLPIHKWMRDNGCVFQVRLLEMVLDIARVDAERHWMKSLKGPLLNLTDGGPGMSGHKFAGSEHARRIGSAIRTGADCSCLECGETFWRKRREISLGNNKFCSRACYQARQRGKSKNRVVA